ncbi:MAG: M56 family metallopeptidase [Candidatus Dormibacteria bacterium]
MIGGGPEWQAPEAGDPAAGGPAPAGTPPPAPAPAPPPYPYAYPYPSPHPPPYPSPRPPPYPSPYPPPNAHPPPPPPTRLRSGAPSRATVVLVPAVCVCIAGWSAALAFNGEPALGPIAAILNLQFAAVLLCTSGRFRGVDPGAAAQWRVQTILAELCPRAGCAMPQVTVTRGGTRPIGVRGGWGRQPAVLLISVEHLDRLGDRELRAVVAHELIHVRHKDSTAARARGLGALAVAVALVVAAAVVAPNPADYPIWFTAWLVGVFGGGAALSVLNRPRETRADAEGALLAGDPAALARGLTALADLAQDIRRRLYRPPILRWLLWPWSSRMPSHPPLAARLAHLREIETGQVQGFNPPGGASFA